MWFSSVLGCVSSRRSRPRLGQGRHGTTGPRSARLRLSVECLEDRCLLSSGVGGLSFLDPVDYGVGRSPRSVTVADFNGDDLPDVAVANSASNDVSVFLGNSDGSLRPVGTVAVGTTPSFVASGDFDGDRLTDLAVVNTGSGNVSILRGNGSGGFELAGNLAVGVRPVSIAVGDVSSDGNLDLAVANAGANTVSILRGQGNCSFESANHFATGGSI